jgi:hypothetical protein
MNNGQNEPGILIGAAAADCESMLASVSTDPKDIIRGMVSRVTRLEYPTAERERQAASILQSRLTAFEELLRNGDLHGVRRLANEIETRIRLVTIPERDPSFQEERRRTMAYFLNRGWLTEETEPETLGTYWKPGDRIGEIRAGSVKLGERTITRAQVRERMKHYGPAVLSNSARKEEVGVSRERENEARLARGEEPAYGSL